MQIGRSKLQKRKKKKRKNNKINQMKQQAMLPNKMLS